ncbi:hypothetical protein F0L74_27130 [Chitinophaga agrisoli]|uniref:Uncharacterized protein n=1 Tax=Chitinophaga agrisoli TaxID=2607653 RepID=A0A5B2VJU1_9BACT|nr:hypothetical protein [Chitinophaga agrisoli]KAA2239863.1 hypothetical protein F0L74_27130 [Chitinophaga agrisoli]
MNHLTYAMKTLPSIPDTDKSRDYTMFIRVLAAVVMVLGVTPLFLPVLRPWILSLLLLCPPGCFMLLRRLKLQLALKDGEEYDLPITFVLLITGLIHFLYPFFNVRVSSYGAFWVLVVIAMAGYIWAGLAAAGPEGRYKILRSPSIGLLIAGAFGSCFGGIHLINQFSCFNPPAHYAVRVFHKNLITREGSSATSLSFELELAPWGPKTSESIEEVPRSVFFSVLPPDTVGINLYKGGLGLSWYKINGE